MGYNVTVLTSGYKGFPGIQVVDGMQVYRCPAIRRKVSESNMLEMLSFVTSACLFLPWIIKSNCINNMIVFFSFPCGPLGLIAKLFFKTPYVISLRGGDVPGNEKELDKIHQVLKPLRRMIYKYSKAVIANSSGLKKVAQKADPVSVSVIPNGVDTLFFCPDETRVVKESFDFIFAGRLSRQKNLCFLLEQLSELIKNESQKIILHMVGDGPLKNELLNYCHSLKIFENVLWYGWEDKTQILRLFRQSDCFLNFSFYEGMPNSVLEAMACGLPVIASNVPGNDALVSNDQNGFLFDLDDSQTLQLALKKIVQAPDQGFKMGQKSRERVISEFSWYKAAYNYHTCFSINGESEV